MNAFELRYENVAFGHEPLFRREADYARQLLIWTQSLRYSPRR